MLADSNILAAVSGIYSFPAPQNASYETKPYIMITRLNEQNWELIDGEEDWYDEEWQIDILGKTDKIAETVKELVETRMYQAPGTVLGNYRVSAVSLDVVVDGTDLEDMGGEGKVGRKILTYSISRDRDNQ